MVRTWLRKCQKCKLMLPTKNFLTYKKGSRHDFCLDCEKPCNFCKVNPKHYKGYCQICREYCENKKLKRCYKCDEILPDSSFPLWNLSNHSYMCKNCITIYQSKLTSSLNAFFTKMVSSCKRRAELKALRGRQDAGKFNLSVDHLLKIYNKQDGKCYYSGIKLTTQKNSNW